MSDDLIQRLRRLYVQQGTDYVQEAADTIERLQADGIHTCNPACPRIACVQRREIERLTAERDALRAALESIVRAAQAHACHHALSVDGQMMYDIAASQLAAIDAYCDTHCTWLDHAAGCVRADAARSNDD